jgi:two-component system cell cycle sensor histidine kinase/response regulator CckA
VASNPILVVDHNPANLTLVQGTLASQGYEVRTATDAEAALAVLEVFHPVVIVVEVKLRGMDGLELTRRLRADPRTRQVAILALAQSTLGDEEQVLAAGFDGYIPKPINTRQLASQVANLLSRASAGPPEPRRRWKVLIVDDNPINRKRLRLTLEAEGHRAIEAADGVEGLEKLRSTDVDAVISDVLMPKMDGYRLSYEVRRSAELREIPIVIYSSTHAPPAEAGLTSNLGVDRFVPSPAPAGVILEALADAVGSRRSLRRIPAAEELARLKEYSEGLVLELEKKNLELESARDLLSTANEALRRSEKRYRDLVHLAPIGVFQSTPDDRFLAVNDAFATMLGYDSPAELIQLPANEVYAEPGDHAALIASFDRSGRVAGREMRLKQEDGTLVWVRADGRAVRNASGELERYELFVTDIGEQRRTAEALGASEERYRALMEHAHDAIFVNNEYGVVQEVNRAAEILVGATREEIVGRSFLETLRDEDREQVLANFRKTLERGRTLKLLQVQIQRRDGTTVPAEVTASVVQIGGKPFVVGLLRDVSERNAMAEQLRVAQKMDAIGQLAGGVAHDFNNLLTAILGYSQLLAPELRGNPEHFTAIEEIRKAGERAAGLTRQLLAFSRKQILEPKVLDLNEVVHRMEEMLSRLIGEDIQIMMKLDPALGSVRADAGQIEQVIMNLAVNARDAMPKGGEIAVETANAELAESYTQTHVPVRPGLYVMLAVSDTGFGMDSATRERIYEPFFTTKEKGQGTGLGLSTVYGIVKQSSGYIWVYSEPGRGTSFKVYLPRVQLPAEKLVVPEPAALPSLGNETILLVEDEDSVRALARRTLEASGYRVLEAADGGGAVEIALAETVDLLLTDMVLPGMGGRAIAARIHEIHPQAKVLYTSGYTDDVIFRGGLLERGAAFLEKPFTPNVLARRVRQVLDS